MLAQFAGSLLSRLAASAVLAAAVSATESSTWTSARAECSAASPLQCPGEHLLLQRGSERASGHPMHLKHLLVELPQADGRLYAKRSLVADEGNGVGEHHGVSLDECGIACDGVPACQSFSYSDYSRACYMKDQEVTMESVPKERRTWDWHLRTYFPIEPNSSVPLPPPVNRSDAVPGHSYIERTLVANEGGGIHTEAHVTAAECEKKCDVIGACRSFAYSAEQRMCFLKDAVVTLEDAARVPQYLDYKTYIQVPLCSSHVCAEGTFLRPDADSIEGNDDETCCLPRHSYVERTLVANEGYEIFAKSPVTLAECEDLCDLQGACRSFAYSVVQRSCHLKETAVTLEDAARLPEHLDYKTYIKAPLCSRHVCSEGTILRPDAASLLGQDDETCCLPRHSYAERTLVANEGGGVSTGSHMTLFECEKLCDLEGACRSFAYSAEQRMCYLKDAVVTVEDAARVPQHLDYKTYIQIPLCSNHVCTAGMVLLPNATSIPGGDDETCCEAS